MKSLKEILIIDDDYKNYFALSAVLKSKKYQCVTAQSAQEGFEILSVNKNIAVVLMDMMMPEMDGYQAIKKIKADPGMKDIYVIAVTAQAMTGDREKCMEAGADGYISKPVNVTELIKELNKVIS